MNVHDKVALRQLALRNALVSKKTKIEARRERILADVNKMVSERRALDTKLAMLDELLRSRGGIPTGAVRPSEVPVSIPGPSPAPLAAPAVELAIPEKHKKRVARAVIADSPEEAILLPLLGSEPTHIDALVKASKMEVAAVGSTLILMEMKGKVKNVGGNQYMKVREW